MANGLSPIRSGYRCRHAKTHYLDDSDEEILTDEILEITHYDHYPTLLERWGDDTKTIVRHEGDLKIEDYVEFEELEPTTVEEIVYRVVYAGDEIQSYVPIHTCRSQSRNFRKLKKRRTKRKIQPHDDEHRQRPMNTSDVDDRARDLLNGMQDLSKEIDLILQTGERVTHSIDDDDELAGADESKPLRTITEGLPDMETCLAASGKSSIFVDVLETREEEEEEEKTSTRLSGLAGERKHSLAIHCCNEEF